MQVRSAACTMRSKQQDVVICFSFSTAINHNKHELNTICTLRFDSLAGFDLRHLVEAIAMS